MSVESAYKDLFLYLDSTRELYPSGVPQPDKAVKVFFIAAEKELFSCPGTGGGWAGVKAGLLQAAVTRGMQLPISEACVLDIMKLSNLEALELIKEKLRCQQALVVVVLGLSAAQKVFNAELEVPGLRLEDRTLEGVPVICTSELDSVLENSAVKKEFWQDLKKAMKYLV